MKGERETETEADRERECEGGRQRQTERESGTERAFTYILCFSMLLLAYVKPVSNFAFNFVNAIV